MYCKPFFISFISLFFFIQNKAQIFDWKNPNELNGLQREKLRDSALTRQAFLIKKDSLNIYFERQFRKYPPDFFQNLSKNQVYLPSSFFRKQTADLFTNDSLYLNQKEFRISLGDEVLKKQTKDDFFNQLNAKGSFIRGMSFGNNQGSSVQSSMEMQISGKLNKDITLLASITDHNLPVQADGYTQSLQEFDKIYLQLNVKKNHELRAGHLDLYNDSSFFGKYQRRSLGLQYVSKWGNKQQQTQLMFSGGFARSEFNRVRFQGTEGNQGPYRLSGKNNESFITIISGSEQVYIDGVLMKRGETLDYIINYNTGEITFTSFRPIFAQNFIVVSYNYTNRNYNRYLVTSSFTHQRENWRFSMDYFLENDQKNAPLQQNFNKEDSDILTQAGNNPNLMYSPSVVETPFSVDKILYKKTEINGEIRYEYSTNPQEVLFLVNFSSVGANNGSYRLKQSFNNGRIFEYIGENRGDYIPARKLIAPTQSQVLSFSGETIIAKGKAGADFSYSIRDLNLFSQKDNDQNKGFATRIWLNQNYQWGNLKMQPQLEFHHIHHNFLVLDRIQDINFWRNFNLQNEFNQIDQNRLHFSLKNTWKDQCFLNFESNFINEQQVYRGLKNDVDFQHKSLKNWTLAKASLLNTQSLDLKTQFVRANFEHRFLKNKNHWALGASMEDNVKKLMLQNQYDTSSFAWKEVFVERKIGDSLRRNYVFRSYYRTNDSVKNNQLQRVNGVFGFITSAELIKTKKALLTTSLHYRKFYWNDKARSVNNQDYVIGNVLYNQSWFNHGLNLQSFYELGSGQEAQREFQYLKVIGGKGLYKWTDYNGDGLQQLEEFETAEFSDLAQYIRVYTNSIKYVATNKNKLQLALTMQVAQLFPNQNPYLKRLSVNVSVLSQNAYLKGQDVVVANPFENNEFQLIKNQNIIFSTQFNPTQKSPWSSQYKWSQNQNQLLVNFSRDSSIALLQWFSVGYQLRQNLKLDWVNQYKKFESQSQLFSNKRYQLSEWSMNPKVSYTLAKDLLVIGEFLYQKKTRIDGVEQLKSTQLSSSLQYDFIKTNLKLSFSFINNQFDGPSFSLVANQMLEGLKTNRNLLWNLNLQRKINSFLMLNINYDGRQSAEKTIHIGSVQLKALF